MKQLTYILIIISLITFSFTACTPTKDVVLSKKTCNTTGVVKDFTGKLDGCTILIALENGNSLLPVEYSVEIPELKDNQKISFSYEEVEAMTVCMAGKTVKITCLTIL